MLVDTFYTGRLRNGSEPSVILDIPLGSLVSLFCGETDGPSFLVQTIVGHEGICVGKMHRNGSMKARIPNGSQLRRLF